jgi:hypothetical protein
MAKAVTKIFATRAEKAMSGIQASRWLGVSGLLLSSAFILALVFR